MIDLTENKDYELILPADAEDNDAWHVRFLNGDFVETVVEFGAIQLNEDLGCLNFNFDIVYTPDNNLNVDNEELQEHAGATLMSVIETAMKNNELVTKDAKD